MFNDTKINHKLKVKILNHVSGLQGKITKPRLKFVCEMTYGILSSERVLLFSNRKKFERTDKASPDKSKALKNYRWSSLPGYIDGKRKIVLPVQIL